VNLNISSNTYTYLKFNVIIIISFLVSLLLSYFKFPYLQNVFGILIIVVGSLNIAAAIEIFLKERQGLTKISIWTILFSIFIFPVFSWLLLQLLPVRQISQILISIIYPVITFCLYFLFEHFIKHPEVTKIKKYDKSKLKQYFFLGSLYTLVLSVHFFLYKYIPEADPYNYLIKVDQFSSMGFSMLDNVRPLFSILLYSISATTSISSYWILKIVFPLFFVVLPLLIAKPIIDSKGISKYTYLPILLFLSFPVVVEEVLVSRPQSLFLLSLPLFLYLMSNLSIRQKNSRSFIAPLAILALSVIGLKIHPFFGLSAFIALLVTIVAAWPMIKKHPIDASVIALALAGLLIPQLRNDSIGNLKELLSVFVKSALNPNFTFWFIDSYVSVDGIQMGWPGVTAIFYYLYNWGLAFPIIALAYLYKRKQIASERASRLYISVIFLFFIVAEIFPRLGLAYLPDRAWLFIAVILPFVFSPILIRIYGSSRAFVKTLLLFSLIISISISYFITYTKSGWTSENEMAAAAFLRHNTPPDSLVIAQGGNVFTVNYFAQRVYIDLNNTLLERDLDDFKQEVSLLGSSQEQIRKIDEEINKEKGELLTKFKDQLFQNGATSQRLNQLTNSSLASINHLLVKRKVQMSTSDNKEVFLMYSTEKFTGLYGMRDWWKSNNLYGADLSKTKEYPVVFEQGGVKIWKLSE